MRDPSITLLTWALFRTLIWGYGAWHSYRFRRPLAFAGCTLAALNGTVFAFANAGYRIPPGMLNLATSLGTPITALLVGAIVLGQERFGRQDRWRP